MHVFQTWCRNFDIIAVRQQAMSIPWEAMANSFSMLASQVDDLLSNQHEFDKIVAVDETWSIALASIVATATNNDFIIASNDQCEASCCTSTCTSSNVAVCCAVVTPTTIIAIQSIMRAIDGQHVKITIFSATEINSELTNMISSVCSFAAPKLTSANLPQEIGQCLQFRRACAAQIESNSPGEDRYCMRIKRLIGAADEYVQGYAVLDGHGGFLAADIASTYLLENIVTAISMINISHRTQDVIARIISNAFVECDELVLETACTLVVENKKALGIKGCPGRAGCCAVVTILVDGNIFVGHVGDCRAVMYSSNVACMNVSTSTCSTNISPVKRRRHDMQDTCPNELVDSSATMKKYDEYEEMVNNPASHQAAVTTRAQGQSATAVGHDVGGAGYAHGDSLNGRAVQCITTDHSCCVDMECRIVKTLSSDPHPLRQSQAGIASFGRNAPLRVAGSLAITRAFGDGYLKRKQLSAAGFQDHVPYIGCKPTIYCRALLPSDRAIILGSDGLWNHLPAHECCSVLLRGELAALGDNKNTVDNQLTSSHCAISQVHEFMKSSQATQATTACSANSCSHAVDMKESFAVGGFVSTSQSSFTSVACRLLQEESESPDISNNTTSLTVADLLLRKCLCNAAKFAGLNPEVLTSMAPGPRRRATLDDVTVMVVPLNMPSPDNITASV